MGREIDCCREHTVTTYSAVSVCSIYILITLYLLNRFDLIFLMLDPQDEQFDRRLGTHLVSLYHQTQDQEDTLHMVI